MLEDENFNFAYASSTLQKTHDSQWNLVMWELENSLNKGEKPYECNLTLDSAIKNVFDHITKAAGLLELEDEK